MPVAPIITEVDGEFAGLAGFYGGWLINQKFLIGGAAYFQTNGGNESDMKYGGAVFEYFFNPLRVANISVRGLVGGGTATLNRFRLEGLRFPGRGNFGLRNLDLGSINLGNLVERLGGRFPFEGIDLDSLLERGRSVSILNTSRQFAQYCPVSKDLGGRLRGLFFDSAAYQSVTAS